jgi:hypothetical protein
MSAAAETSAPAPDLEAAADQAIAACGGDAREAVKALIVANGFLETQVDELRASVSPATRAPVRRLARSNGFVRLRCPRSPATSPCPPRSEPTTVSPPAGRSSASIQTRPHEGRGARRKPGHKFLGFDGRSGPALGIRLEDTTRNRCRKRRFRAGRRDEIKRTCDEHHGSKR